MVKIHIKKNTLKSWQYETCLRILKVASYGNEESLKTIYSIIIREHVQTTKHQLGTIRKRIVGNHATSIRVLACDIDDREQITRYAGMALHDRPYYTLATMKQCDLNLHKLTKKEEAGSRQSIINKGKFRILSVRGLITTMDKLAENVLWSSVGNNHQLVEDRFWKAVLCVSFSLSCRLNEIITTNESSYQPCRDDFKIDGVSCIFSSGSKTKDGAPRPSYTKLLLLGSERTRALLDLIFSERVKMRHFFLNQTGGKNFKNIVESAGIPEHIECMSFAFTPKMFRSLSATIIPYVYNLSAIAVSPHSAAILAVSLQLGHEGVSTVTTETYIANDVVDDNIDFVKTPVCIDRGQLCTNFTHREG